MTALKKYEGPTVGTRAEREARPKFLAKAATHKNDLETIVERTKKRFPKTIAYLAK